MAESVAEINWIGWGSGGMRGTLDSGLGNGGNGRRRNSRELKSGDILGVELRTPRN